MSAERSATPSVSLLMPNRDNGLVLDRVLEALATNTDYPDYELIVVDDGSTDASRDILRRWRGSSRIPEFRVLEIEHRAGGVVDALNTGLRAAAGDLIVQLDADASLETPGWLQAMVEFFTSDPRIGGATARVVMDSGELQACGIEVVGPEGYHDRGSEITEEIGKRTSHQQVRRRHESEWDQCERLAEVDGGMGVCMMYARAAAIELGGYDRGYAPVWLDDLDLTISLRREGLKVFYVPEVRIVHHLGLRARPDDRPKAPGRTRTAATMARRGIGAALSQRTKTRIVHALGWNQGPTWYRERLAQHFGYWHQKWGWDMLNPDMDAIQRRWGHTEICWKSNPDMRLAGEQIITSFQTRAQRPPAGPAGPVTDPDQIVG